MIIVLNWQTFHSRYYNNSRIYVKESDEYWEFYTQDGVIIIKSVVEKDEDEQKNIAFVERFLQGREDVLRAMEVFDTVEDSEEEESSPMESDAAVREEDEPIEDPEMMSGYTSTDADHSHEYIIDKDGNGVTTSTLPKDHNPHIHTIKEGVVEGSENHSHVIETYVPETDLENEE